MADFFPPIPTNTAGLPHDNAGPSLNVTVWTLTGLATFFLGLRIYCKYLGRRNLWWDDYMLIASWVALIISCSLVSVLISHGLGRHSWDLSPDQLGSFSPTILIRITLTIIAAAWSKTSFAITILRIAEGRMRWLLWFIIISINMALGAAALVVWIGCTPVAKAWDPTLPGTCWPISTNAAVNVFAGIYSGSMDIALAVLPLRIIWNLQMKPKEKIGVGVAMSMAILAGGMAYVKTYKLKALTSDDFYDSADLTVWDHGEGAVTIMAASIPVLRVLIREAALATKRFYTTTMTRNRGGQSPTPLKPYDKDVDDRSDKDVVIDFRKEVQY